MKKVTVIIPTYNEEKYIKDVILSLLNDDYPKDLLEILVIDGRSTDKTRQIVMELSKQYPNIKLLDNPKRWTPVGLNIGIKNATGYYIIRADAHTLYPPNYISNLIYWLEELKAANVGAKFDHTPRRKTKQAIAIAKVFSSPFGVGNAVYRTTEGTQPIEVDTVPYGTWRKEIFDKLGLFNEKLHRNQDIEFNKRILRSGGKIYLLPFIKIKYLVRDTYFDLIRYAYKTGFWNILTVYYTRTFKSLSLRHFVPMFFVLGLVLPLIFSAIVPWLWVLSVLGIILYFTTAFYFALKISRDTSVWYILLAFFLLHFFYGIGELFALFILPLKKR